MASPEQKLTDDEKFKLLEFYKENRELWVSHGVPKTLKIVKKDELVAEFQGKFTIEALERTFHSLKAGFTRESKRYGDGNEPKKTWKFYKKMLFLKEEAKITRVQFTTAERETVIDFYQSNPPLWNHGIEAYRNRDIRRSLLEKLRESLDEKFTEEDIKKEWNALLTRYRKERQLEKASRSSGAGIDDIYDSKWEHFHQIEFLESTPEADIALSTLDKPLDETPPASKKSKTSSESDARAALYNALAKSFEEPSKISKSKVDENSLSERAALFGKTVADNLLQCDPKDWTLIKKKIFDLFFDYEQGNLTAKKSGGGYQSFVPTNPPFQEFPWFNQQNYSQNNQAMRSHTPNHDPFSPFSPTNSNCSG